MSETCISCDPTYRSLVRASRDDATALAVCSDYLQERGLRPLGAGLAPAERSATAGYYTTLATAEEFEARAERILRAEADRAAREARESREKKYAEVRKDVALALGRAYHARIADLFASKRASVVWGRGGQEDLDWDAYGKSGKNYGGRPAHWTNAGALVIGFGRSGRVVLETHRGTEVARLPLPPAGAVFAGDCLVSGDLYATVRVIAGVRVATRYGVTHSRVDGRRLATGYAPAGIAVRFEVPPDCREQGRSLWGIFGTTAATYWEHGTDVAACRAEYARKLEAAEVERAAAYHSDRRKALAEDVAALCPGLVVTHADRKAAGYCDAGASGFLARHNLVGRETLTAAELRATGAREVERPIAMAARRVLEAALAK